MMKIAHLANFYSPRSGGLRTTMHALGEEYVKLGHEVLLVTPGAQTEFSNVGTLKHLTVQAPEIPGSGGYRMILRMSVIRHELTKFAPDVIEISDRTTLLAIARWAKRRAIPVYFFAHERILGVLSAFIPWLPRKLQIVNFWNKVTIRAVDHVVATTESALQEFEMISHYLSKSRCKVSIVPLGVDLQKFSPVSTVTQEIPYVLACTRLSREKDPEFLLDIAHQIVKRDFPVRLEIIGTGPLEEKLRTDVERFSLPVIFHGYLHDKTRIQKLMSGAEIFLAVGPIETFGLAAMESLACGTPVMCRDSSAISELINLQSGISLERSAEKWVDHIVRFLAVDRLLRRDRARERAESFTWERTVSALLETYTAELIPQ